MIRLVAVFLLTLVLSFSSSAQISNEVGKPFITNYIPKEYGAHPQNWAIAQDHRGVMYFGNSNGVLEYDGINWRVIKTTNNTSIQSLDIDKDGKIYVGAQGDLGYLQPDSLGQMSFISLINHIKPEDRIFGNIWYTLATDDGIFFQDYNRIFLWTGIEMKVWKSARRFLSTFFVNNTFYVHQSQVGLLEIVNDSLQLVSGGERFANFRIDALLTFNDEKLLIVTRSQGLYLFDGKVYEKFETEVGPFLLENQLYAGAVLPDGSFALATMRGGVAIIDKKGQLIQILNESSGLLDNLVRSVYSDRQGALWLGLDSGISRVETPSPLSIYDKQAGLQSYVVSIIRHNKTLYVATGLGVFYLDSASRQFRYVSGLVARSWSFASRDDFLLVGTDDGIYSIKNNKAYPVIKSQNESFRVYSLGLSNQNKNRVFVGLIDGFASLRKENTQWINEGRIDSINESIRNIIETNDGTLWLGTQSKGVVSVQFAEKSTLENPQIKYYGEKNGLPNGGVAVFSISGTEFFVMFDGLFRFDKSTDSFSADSSLTFVNFGGSQEEYSLKEDKHGNIWINFGRETAFAIKQSDGSYLPQKTTFMQISSLPNYYIYPENDGVTWFGSEEVLVRYDPNIKKEYLGDFPSLIRSVTANEDSLIFGGASKVSPPQLAHNYNAIRFQFASPSFDDATAIQFQHILEGFEKKWSVWSRENSANYTNLPHGNYRFRVRSKNLYEQESQEADFSFKILPPWYKTLWAYLSYFLVVMVGMFTFDQFQRKRLIKKGKEKMRLALLEAENNRKSDELEEARKLQLAMIPKNVPQLPDLDIAAYMNPATEVGGDYYDFHISHDGMLTIGFGDATGHGLNAGMMVTATKSLFKSLAEEPEPIVIITISNRVLKQMNLHTLNMAMMILKLKNKKLAVCGAGMPPIILYKKNEDEIEEIMFTGMPLGSMTEFPYEERSFELNSGDTLLLMSDGFPERLNQEEQMFDYFRAYESFKEMAQQSPEAIIKYLKKESDRWANGRPQDDDVTFVVIKIK